MRIWRGQALLGVVGCLAALLAEGAPRSEFRAVAVSTAAEAQEFPAAVLKEDGGLYIVWHDTRHGDRDVYGQRYGAEGNAAWDPDGRPLVALEGDQGWVCAADDRLDGFVVVWGDARSGGRELYAQRFDAQGSPQWQPRGAPVSLSDSGKDDHRMVPDGHGGYYIVWEDWRQDGLDVYGQWIDAGGNARWPGDGLAICDSRGHQYDPAVASSEESSLVAWWSVEGPDWRVYAQRIAPDGRRLWGQAGMAAALAQANQSAPIIVSDGEGGAFVAWADSRNDDGTYSNLDVYAQHFGPDGRRDWGDSGRAICDAPGTQQHVTGISDGRGGIYFAWTDGRDVFDDIYVQHLQGDGAAAWPANGLPVCVADGRQREPHLALAAGQLWIAWFDYRRETFDETPEDVYVQRIDRDGSFLYDRDGLALKTQPGSRSSLALVARGPHVAVTWMDLLPEGADVYAAVGEVPGN